MQEYLHSLLVYIDESRLVMSWVDMLDIAFIAAFFSIALVWLQRRTSRSILFALIPMLVTFVTARTLKMTLTSLLFEFGLMALGLSIVIIFQDDFRRAFEALASWRPWSRGEPAQPTKVADTLTETLTALARSRTGALIILQGRQSLDAHLRAGVEVRGKLSATLLQSIFDPHSPGHDGAVTIVNGKIDKLGVHLPLSRNAGETGRLGTRHAAALGLAEKCDALVLVVSEETGTISLARDGRLVPSKSAAMTRDAIRDQYRRLGPLPLHRTLWEIPWGRLTTSTVIACSLWIVFARPSNLIQRMVDAPIVYKTVPSGWDAKPPVPSRVKLSLFGPESQVMRLEPAAMAVVVDLSRVKEGQQRFAISEANLELPNRVLLKWVEPSEVAVQAYPTSEYEIPVQLNWQQMPSTVRLPSSTQWKLTPGKVSLKIPKSGSPPKVLDTEPISVLELRRLGRLKVKLRLPAELAISELSAPEVEVALTPAGSAP